MRVGKLNIISDRQAIWDLYPNFYYFNSEHEFGILLFKRLVVLWKK
jgi:hypothetical protein